MGEARRRKQAGAEPRRQRTKGPSPAHLGPVPEYGQAYRDAEHAAEVYAHARNNLNRASWERDFANMQLARAARATSSEDRARILEEIKEERRKRAEEQAAREDRARELREKVDKAAAAA